MAAKPKPDWLEATKARQMLARKLGDQRRATHILEEALRQGKVSTIAEAMIHETIDAPISITCPKEVGKAVMNVHRSRENNKIVIGQAFWRNEYGSFGMDLTWNWHTGVFSSPGRAVSSEAVQSWRKTLHKGVHTRLVIYGVSFRRQDVEALVASHRPNPSQRKALDIKEARVTPARRTKWPWHEALKQIEDLGPEGIIAKFGRLEPGFQARIEEEVERYIFNWAMENGIEDKSCRNSSTRRKVGALIDRLFPGYRKGGPNPK